MAEQERKQATESPSDMARIYAVFVERERRELARARECGAREEELRYLTARVGRWQDKLAAVL